MSERARLLVQKRTTLKSQITNLQNLVDKGKLDNATLKLRIARLTVLYHAFEESTDELSLLEPGKGHEDEYASVQDRFYELAGRVEQMLNPVNVSRVSTDPLDDGTRDDESGLPTPVKRRRIKLPEAPLLTFDGNYENWLSFKSAFQSMIGSRTDLDDFDKLHYLRAALRGEAANKIKIFEVDGAHYTTAWKLLERSYEVKRLLVSRHLASIMNMPVMERETSSGLTKLADDAQQHVAALRALGVSVGSEVIVHILEGKLPRGTSEKWEASLDRDEFPKPDKLYEFLYKTAVCASRRERTGAPHRERRTDEPSVRKKQVHSANQAFLLDAPRSCVICKDGTHQLYMCGMFKRLSVPKRIEAVRRAKLCLNCLRSHRGTPCRYSSCTMCQGRHNTLLHDDQYTNASRPGTSKSDTITPSA